MNVLSTYKSLPRGGKIGVAAAAVILLYALFGFLILPMIVKSVLLSNIKENLKRNAELAQLRVNPFALSLTARGFEMYDLGGEPFVGFDELYVNFQLSSIFRRAYTFDEIRLTAPDASIKILADGNLNFSDLMASEDKPESVPAEEADLSQVAGLPQVLIFNLTIEQGRLAFADLSRPTPFETTLFPMNVVLNDFSTRRDSDSPYAFAASMGGGELLSWEGDFSVNPVRSRGSFKLANIKAQNLWKYIQHQVNFEVAGGLIGLRGDYETDIGAWLSHFKFTEGELDITELELTGKGGDETLISVPELSVRGGTIDVDNREAVFESVSLRGARFKAWITEDRNLNFQDLFAVTGQPDQEDAPPVADIAGPDDQVPGWLLTVNEAALNVYTIEFEDRMPSEPVRISLGPIDVKLQNVSNRRNSHAQVVLNVGIGAVGTFSVEGSAGANPVFADLGLKASEIALRPFQPYVDAFARVDILSGAAGLDGRLKYGAGEDAPEIQYEGGIALSGFEAVDRSQSDDFIKCESLALNGLSLDVNPNRLGIAEVVARQPYARVIIWPDATLNLSKIFVGQEPEGTEEAEETKSAEPEPRPEMPIKVAMVRIENGSANFADYSLEPNFATGIHELSGTIEGLSSESLALADVSLEGKVDEYASMSIVGQINPLAEDVYTDLAVSFQNIELTSFTPYSGKFVGYTVAKGKLSLDLKYKVSENILIGENKIVLDQLTLGERVESPDATKLPVGLAIALLKDRNGVIDIDLPIRGDLNDPEFSYGPIVIRALVNIIVKAATSPFGLLGALVGSSGEELSFVEFQFGSAELGPGEAAKLDTLAAALSERPMLQLEIKGTADTEHDPIGLAERKLLSRLKRMKLEESGSRGKGAPEDVEDVSLTDEDYSRFVIRAYLETFDEDPRILLEAQAEQPTAEGETIAEEEETPVAPRESRLGPGGMLLNIGQQFIGNVQGLLGIGSAENTKSKVILRDVGRSSEGAGILVQKARQRLVENIPIEEIDLRLLAQERANRIKGYLIEQGGIANEKVFILEPELGGPAAGDAIRMNLALSGK